MRWLLSALALTFIPVGLVRAQTVEDVCEAAPKVLQCFHPTGAYVRCERTAPGRAKIYFKGALTRFPYHLEVLTESRAGGFSRLILLEDTAKVPANRRCALTEWHPK